MIDYVMVPMARKSTAGAPFHSFRGVDINKYMEASGVPRKKVKVTSRILARRLKLAAKGVPFATPPTQRGLYGVTHSSATKSRQCSRVNCPIHLYEGDKNCNHSWSTFTPFD